MCTSVDDCGQIEESCLKPPFESPHLDSLRLENMGKLRFLSSQHPSPTVKNLLQLRTATIWLEVGTSRDAQSVCSKRLKSQDVM